MWFSGSCCLNKFWNVTVLQIFFQNPLCHLILSPTLFSDFSVDLFLSDSGYFKYLQLWKIPLALPNTSGYEKYLWLVQIPLALKNSWCWFLLLSPAMNTPAISNTSSYEWLQLFQIPLAMKNTSSSWLLQNPLFSGWELLKGSCPFGFFL